MEDHLEQCDVDATQFQIVPFEPIVKDERKKEPPAVKRQRLDDALAILSESPEPPYRCPDCMNESYTPIDYLTHLGEDHFVHAEEDENSFAPNKRKYSYITVQDAVCLMRHQSKCHISSIFRKNIQSEILSQNA